MLKERKIAQEMFVIRDGNGNERPFGEKDCYGFCKVEGFDGADYATIKDGDIIKKIEGEESYLAEVKTEAVYSDYHTFSETYPFNGVLMAFNLNMIDTKKYFGEDYSDKLFNYDELLGKVRDLLNEYHLLKDDREEEISIHRNGYLRITINNQKLDDKVIECSKKIEELIQDFYSKSGVHITRMFGSYILLKNIDGKLRAVKATPIPIKYCPLMVKLLREVGGCVAEDLIESLEESDVDNQTKLMCELINKVIIDGGYFDTNRPLNSCEANVLFGASETMYSAFMNDLIDASVIVSNNLGTIITTNAAATQGSVKRMTGLFYTSPDEKIVETAKSVGIIPVFPITGEIDQLEGVRRAIELGYKRIAVSVAAHDNILHSELAKLEKEHDVKIYKFGLCSTGIDEKTALAMKDYADVIWSCASKQVKEVIEPNAIAQVGIKIPVHIMTKRGWEIVRNHLINMDKNIGDVNLQKGEDKPVLLHGDEKIKVFTKKNIHKCSDCPNPCV